MLDWVIISYLPMTMFVYGMSVGVAVLTAASLLSAVGLTLVLVERIRASKPLVTRRFLAQPAVLFALFYFLVGIASGIFAADKDRWLREVVQRAIIIICPLYVHACGPVHPRVLWRALLAYIPVGTLLAIGTLAVAVKSGLHAPSFFGMHKNAVGADCAHLAVICFAFLLARQFPKMRLPLVGIMVLAVVAAVGAQARAALLGTVLASYLMMLANRTSFKSLVLAGLVVASGIGIMAVTLPEEAIHHAVTTEKFSSNAVRQETWALISDKLRNNPMMWVGWGNPVFEYIDLHVSTGFAKGVRTVVADCANIFFYDWAQMSILGVIAQIGMFSSALVLAVQNARRCPQGSRISAINLAALGIMVTRFEQAYLDSFWVGRGPTLATFAAVGITVFIKLWLDQHDDLQFHKRSLMRSAQRRIAADVASPLTK